MTQSRISCTPARQYIALMLLAARRFHPGPQHNSTAARPLRNLYMQGCACGVAPSPQDCLELCGLLNIGF